MQTFKGRGVIVVGASTGIGRASAVRAVREGAEVVFGARRQELLDEAIAQAGGGSSICVDLSDAVSCSAFATRATELLGQIDLVLFTAGQAPLRPVEVTTAAEWATAFATNAIAFNLIVASLLPSLRPSAVVAALSSEAVEMPRYGLSAYGASKAALEHALRVWRLEHPEVRFSTVTVGSTVPTDFGAGFDREVLMTALDRWALQGLAQTQFMDTDDLATMLTDLMGVALAHPDISMEHVVLRSPSGITDSTTAMIDAATGTAP